jgi:hypothetical protein
MIAGRTLTDRTGTQGTFAGLVYEPDTIHIDRQADLRAHPNTA